MAGLSCKENVAAWLSVHESEQHGSHPQKQEQLCQAHKKRLSIQMQMCTGLEKRCFISSIGSRIMHVKPKEEEHALMY